MGHPGAVEALARLPLLVRPDLREGALVDLGVVPAGDERAHPADGERPRRWQVFTRSSAYAFMKGAVIPMLARSGGRTPVPGHGTT